MARRTVLRASAGCAFLICVAPIAGAQAPAAADGPITYAHHHLNVTSIPEHKRFWVDALGGTSIGILGSENVKFPGVLIRLRQQIPTGGTEGTSVNHVAFQVPDIRQAVDRLKAAGYIASSASPDANSPNARAVFVMGPDNVKVELVEHKALAVPIALHHVHFVAPNASEMAAWYAKTFNATPGRATPDRATRGRSFESAELPGVSLRFESSANPPVATKGRVIDHIGLEVKGFTEFYKGLQAAGVKFDRGFTKAVDFDSLSAVIVDPWGTYIELTEGLDKHWR